MGTRSWSIWACVDYIFRSIHRLKTNASCYNCIFCWWAEFQTAKFNKSHNLVNNSFYNPSGKRGLCRHVRAANYSNKDNDFFIKNSNKDVKLIFQIEGKNGFNNIDQIIINKNVRNIFIGPYDLSGSMGIPGKLEHKKLIKTINIILEKGKKFNKYAGIHVAVPDIKKIKKIKKSGFKFIGVGMDSTFLKNASDNFMKQVHEKKN